MTRPITELEGALEAFARGLTDDAERLLGKIGHAALARSMKRTPVRTGTLRRSETTRVERDRAYLGSAVEYAQYVHDGTQFMRAQPFFEEGIQDAVPDMAGLVKDWVEDIWKREVGR